MEVIQECVWLQDLGAAGRDGGLPPEDHHHHYALHRGSASSSHGQYLPTATDNAKVHIHIIGLNGLICQWRFSPDLEFGSQLELRAMSWQRLSFHYY